MADFNQNPPGQTTLALALPEIMLGLGASDLSILIFRQNIPQSENGGATIAATMPPLEIGLGSNDAILSAYRISFFIPSTPNILLQSQTQTQPILPPSGQIYPRGLS